MLAKLFSKPANILVLDEPTNDLDVETLELLEEQLSEFKGTVIVISHDREFLDNVVTDTIFLDGTGRVREFVGGYSDWRRQGGVFPAESSGSRPDKQDKREKTEATTKKPEASAAPAAKSKPVKLSYKLKLELEQLPGKIEALEREVAEFQQAISAPDFYSGDPEKVSKTLEQLSDAEARLEQVIERWMELEEQAGQ